jgi:hypothetical protein
MSDTMTQFVGEWLNLRGAVESGFTNKETNE